MDAHERGKAMDDERTLCPYLLEAMADRLWLFPTTGYCRPPGVNIRVPGKSTVARICTTAAHLTCAGYRAGLAGPGGARE